MTTTTLQRFTFIFSTIIGLSFSSIVLAQSVPSTCPLDVQGGRTIVSFSGDTLRSDLEKEQARTSIVLQNIPAGLYDVTFVSYDGYVSRNQDVQENERWSVVLMNDAGVVAQTNATTDLDDGVDEVVQVDEIKNFNLAEDSTGVIAFHSSFPSKDINTVIPICVAFDEVIPELISEVDESETPIEVEEDTVVPIVFSYPTDEAGQCSFVTDTLGSTKTNIKEEVYKLQAFLNIYEKSNLEINGFIDTPTIAAVIRFQEKYSEDILLPWGLSTGTGYVGITTKHKINEIYCGKSLAYTESELAHMALLNTQTAPSNVQDEDIVLDTPITDVVVKTNEEFSGKPVVEDTTVIEHESSEQAEVVEEDTATEEFVLLAEDTTTEAKENTSVEEEVIITDAVENKNTELYLDDLTFIANESTEDDVKNNDDDEGKDGGVVAVVDSDNLSGGKGIQQTAAVIVGFVDTYSLPILIVLVILLSVQIYVLWREPKAKAF